MTTPNTPPSPASSAPRVNLRTPEVMTQVQAQVESHYRSEIVDRLRASGSAITAAGVTVKLAKQFGFCDGVERAIDLAYAAAKVFAGRRLFILGEIIHNPEVNEQIHALGIRNLVGKSGAPELDALAGGDVVIVPAFGADVATVERIKARGCQIVDTTCGDVMSVWKRVRQNANDDVTSLIHGKAAHEETKATASRAIHGGKGHYLVVLTLEETDAVCDYLRHGGDKAAFLHRFRGAYSEGFDPDLHLRRIGVANQTTMLRGETEEVQRRVKAALVDRDGTEGAQESFRFFDTICGATQERQDALTEMLAQPMNLLLVVGGYNSSNTSHLAELGEAVVPTYFIGNASRIVSREQIRHYNLHTRKEIPTEGWLPAAPVVIGITAGASCPNNLIEETILRVFELHGIPREALL